MSDFGNPNIESGGWLDIRSPRLSNSAAFPANGTITAVHVYLGLAVSSGNMRGAVYSSAGDDPTSATLVSDLGTVATAAIAWYSWTSLSIAATAGVRYWIAYKSDVESYSPYQGSLAAGDWTLNGYIITGEAADPLNAWDSPLATIDGGSTWGVSSYFTYTASSSKTATIRRRRDFMSYAALTAPALEVFGHIFTARNSGLLVPQGA